MLSANVNGLYLRKMRFCLNGPDFQLYGAHGRVRCLDAAQENLHKQRDPRFGAQTGRAKIRCCKSGPKSGGDVKNGVSGASTTSTSSNEHSVLNNEEVKMPPPPGIPEVERNVAKENFYENLIDIRRQENKDVSFTVSKYAQQSKTCFYPTQFLLFSDILVTLCKHFSFETRPNLVAIRRKPHSQGVHNAPR